MLVTRSGIVISVRLTQPSNAYSPILTTLSGRMIPFKKQGSNGINNFAFEDFLNHTFLVPDKYEIPRHLETIMNTISYLQRKQATLTEARDRLLPKLMRGEIEV